MDSRVIENTQDVLQGMHIARHNGDALTVEGEDIDS